MHRWATGGPLVGHQWAASSKAHGHNILNYHSLKTGGIALNIVLKEFLFSSEWSINTL